MHGMHVMGRGSWETCEETGDVVKRGMRGDGTRDSIATACMEGASALRRPAVVDVDGVLLEVEKDD